MGKNKRANTFRAFRNRNYTLFFTGQSISQIGAPETLLLQGITALIIQHLILTCIATSGVVLSTIREAADKDYRITVLADCCTDRDPEIHRVLTTKIFTRRAEVLSVEDWSSIIN
jgi:nicotinamidase-related amidase